MSVDERYLEGCRDGRLLLQRCRSCDNVQFYPRRYCGACHGIDLEFVPATGHGTVYSFTVVRRAPSADWADRVPYPLALVELAEGPRLMTTIVDAPLDELEIGMAVELTFTDLGGDALLPAFRPAAAA